ncbi:NAD(P)-dependent alcohol dehydrogenase [uncultured Maribacter sp.]|uniref:NAD(P)-dependent alcohol dehydrogenase n=1 Tax=uncultured Maribacter sp. TaxID=431308 RepID=UPI0030D7D1AE|tara:strand:+ start:3045 stop:4001 length:957 start_codon:yes stop_codon:yes gene_type:complete
MKAALRRTYGSPSRITLENIKRPEPKDNEVLIQVHATTVNRTDCANLTAKPFIMRFILGLFTPRKKIMGTDFAGEVVALGSHIKSSKIGDRVVGFVDIGAASQAEYVVSAEDEVFPIPENIDYKEAAASIEGAHYAYTFIHKTNIQPGHNILINGATGAIGSALLQFVRQYDVKITATCNTKNRRLIENLGADKIYDYTKEDFTTDTEKYDFIFDTVGKSTFGKCKPLLTNKGVYISSELGPYAQNIFYAIFTSKTRKSVVFPIPYNKKITLPYICDLLKKGVFTPVIDKTYTLYTIAQAYEYVLKGEKTGNVVITML